MKTFHRPAAASRRPSATLRSDAEVRVEAHDLAGRAHFRLRAKYPSVESGLNGNTDSFTAQYFGQIFLREAESAGFFPAMTFAVKGERSMCSKSTRRASAHGAVREKRLVSAGQARAKVMAGKTLKELGFTKEIWPKVLGGEGIRVSVQPLFTDRILLSPKCARPARSWALDADLGNRLRKVADGRRLAAAGGERFFIKRQRRAQKGSRRSGETIRQPRL